jgi:hypothetical protein
MTVQNEFAETKGRGGQGVLRKVFLVVQLAAQDLLFKHCEVAIRRDTELRAQGWENH